MTLRVHIRPEAEADLEEAAAWYERQREGLGQDFLDESERTFDQNAENPLLYPVLHREARRAVVRRFPFGVFYRVEEASIVVVAVMHGSRHPKQWKQRA
ncbi:MAG: type II toxin-antitoxin system RelE/ParE family toxin [Chromatiaceae bacterium]|nr:type II toxin-antitoxin system RelE/ParE family toxin [Chromatiaceae bacterium]